MHLPKVGDEVMYRRWGLLVKPVECHDNLFPNSLLKYVEETRSGNSGMGQSEEGGLHGAAQSGMDSGKHKESKEYAEWEGMHGDIQEKVNKELGKGKGIVEQQLILHPHRCLILLPADTQIIIESLTHKLRFLQAFLQKSDPEAQKVLHQGIRDVAAEAEDKIESKLSDVYLAAAKGEHAASSVEAACEDLHHTLQQVVRDIESVDVGIRDHLQQQKQIKPHTSSSLDSDDDASSSETPSSSLQHIRDGGFSTNYLEPDENVMIALEDGFKKIYWNGMPSEIVNLIHLRHVRLDKGSSLDLPSSVQKNLHTLFWLKVASWDSKPLDFTRVPNLKELGIYVDGELSSDALDGLVQLYRLEKLKIELGRVEHFCVPISFPPNIKKLTLCKTYLPWEEMDIISKLRNLEVLKLKDFAFCGPVWIPSEMFLQLKLLLVAHSDLEHWDADVYNVFPVLECLALRCCWYLKELPSDFASNFDLRLIELIDCCPSLVHSAKMIQQEAIEIFGNGALVVRHFFTEDELQKDESSKEERKYAI
nr:putative late blight resistance protein homolog R1B-14 [Ipomoea batatas]